MYSHAVLSYTNGAAFPEHGHLVSCFETVNFKSNFSNFITDKIENDETGKHRGSTCSSDLNRFLSIRTPQGYGDTYSRS